MHRTAEALDVAASDIADEFLQYLFGMAVIDMDEKAGKGQPAEASSWNDAQITKAAKLVCARQGRVLRPWQFSMPQPQEAHVSA
jgi:hypothetical protein